MTILTAGSVEKKDKKSLFHDVEASAPETAFAPLTHQQQQPRTADVKPFKNRLCLTIFIVSLIGACTVLVLIARNMYYDEQNQELYRATLNIPYDRRIDRLSDMQFYGDSDQGELTIIDPMASFLRARMMDALNDDMFFNEEFELDLSDAESYSKVTVPEFKDGLSGHFLHDFQYNQSLIMDKEKKCCFVMPLDRNTVLQPKSMYDLLNKMVSGYYNIDTQVVKKVMRVVVPPVTDLSDVAPRIVKECNNFNIFMLEKLQTGVFKRSISDNTATYGSFNGNHIAQIQLLGVREADAYNHL